MRVSLVVYAFDRELSVMTPERSRLEQNDLFPSPAAARKVSHKSIPPAASAGVAPPSALPVRVFVVFVWCVHAFHLQACM